MNKNQLCSNCYFNQNGWCSYWKAKIYGEYWCKSYLSIYQGQTLYSTEGEQTIENPSSSPSQMNESSQTYTPPPSTGGGSSGGGGY